VRPRSARVVLGTIVVALIMGGCLTSSAMKVGSAWEIPTGYREVQLSGTTLQIRYKTMAHVQQPGRITTEDTPDRWTSVSLDSLTWVAVDRLDWNPFFREIPMPLECSLTRSPPEPAPAMTLHRYTWPFKRWYSPGAPDYEAPLALYVDQGDSQRVVLVRVSSSDGQRVVTGLFVVHPCRYDLPWARSARAALVPFAVVGDILTSPVQAFLLIFVAAAGFPGH